jgi:ketosteroid isomerase-like protein
MAHVPLDRMPEALGTAFAEGDPAHAWRVQEGAQVEMLGRMVQAIAAGRFDELRAHLADDVTYEVAVPATVPWVRHAAGVEDVVAAIASNFGSVCEQRTEPLALVSQGDTVMVMARETGRMADTGVPYQALLAQQFTLREGRLALFRSVNQVEHA